MRSSKRPGAAGERGVSLIGLLFWAIIIGFIGYVAVRALPTVNEYLTIQSSINKIAATNPTTVGEIRSQFDKQKEIDMRRRLPKGVRMYTGDDFNYAELIAGDEQGNKVTHGGPDQALHQYPSDHYVAWRRDLPADIDPGEHFGLPAAVSELLEEKALVTAPVPLADLHRAGFGLASVGDVADLLAFERRDRLQLHRHTRKERRVCRGVGAWVQRACVGSTPTRVVDGELLREPLLYGQLL